MGLSNAAPVRQKGVSDATPLALRRFSRTLVVLLALSTAVSWSQQTPAKHEIQIQLFNPPIRLVETPETNIRLDGLSQILSRDFDARQTQKASWMRTISYVPLRIDSAHTGV